MLEHRPSQEQDSSSSAYHAPPAVSSLPQNSAVEGRIEDFLDRVFARLVAVLPYEERQRRRAEMRDQLDSLIAAHVELGMPPEQAVEAALAQFQRENAITAQAAPVLLQANTATTRAQLPSARPATLIALGAFSLPYIADATHWAWQQWSAHSSNETAFYRFELLAVPLLAGLATGLLARKRAARGVLSALGLMTIPAILLPGLVWSLFYLGILAQNTEINWLPSPIPGIVGLTWWAGLGCLGAGVGGKLRNGIAKGWKRLNTARRARKRDRALIEQNSVKREILLLESGGR